MSEMFESKEIILGIDFGTTNSVISYFDKGPQVLKDGINSLIPSKVYLGEKKYFGNNIPNINLFAKQNENIPLFENFKSKIDDTGCTSEINNIILLYFKYLFSLVKEFFNKYNDPKFESVLTVPSNFNDIQRNIVLENAKKAGFNIIRLINEPTAAAFAYGLDSKDYIEENILVFDIGGGTFDVSLLEVEKGESGSYFEVVESFGMNDLGGNNFTDCLYEYITRLSKNLSKNHNFDYKLIRKTELWKRCNKAKEKFCFLKKVILSKSLEKKDMIPVISDHHESNDIFTFDINNTKDICRDLLNRIKNDDRILDIKNNIENGDIKLSKILLVGGSSKLIIIQDLIYELFNIKPFVHNQLQHVVSLGACYYGALIKNKLDNFNDIILIDTLPLSLGVETADGNFSVIIPKNTPLPATRSRKYTTDTPGDHEVKIVVYQGEKNVAKNNITIGEINFDKVSQTTNPVINISFKVDLNGIISVCVEDTKTNENKNILIKCKIEVDEEFEEYESFESEKLDEEEAKILNLCYKIKNKVENLLNSDHFSSDKSAAFETNYYESLYESIVDGNDIPSVPELVKIDKELDEKYFLLINNNSTNEITNIHQGENEDDNSYLDIDKIIIDEKLETLNSKIDFYLGKADDLNDEFKKECLLEILENLDNKKLITQKFIDEKLQYIYELFSEDSKDELINLCNFLRTGINNKEIPNNEELKNIIDKSLSNIDLFSGNSSYLEQINKINKICEKM
jgi:molecular chaperone DnaK